MRSRGKKFKGLTQKVEPKDKTLKIGWFYLPMQIEESFMKICEAINFTPIQVKYDNFLDKTLFEGLSPKFKEARKSQEYTINYDNIEEVKVIKV